jgi:hypothetical protein
LVEGSLFTLFLLPFSDITRSDWNVVLHNDQMHTPIWTGGMTTIGVLAILGIGCYIYLSVTKVDRKPPLMSVCAISGLYMGTIVCVLWIVQIFDTDLLLVYLCLFPLNCIVLGANLIRRKILEWKSSQQYEMKEFKNQFLNRLNSKLLRSEKWPLAAFLLMWPILAVIICILIVFGQRPDHLIKAWTETSGWNLSTKIAPQNIYYDEHYLCTVAAGGHPKIVKPIRMGERHGHPVVVNRQLCIANAFEQILEEHTPKFHRHLRHFYDTYGFPIARVIHSPYLADAIYFLMKPLEWFFLLVLYFTDVHPENRIAVQYIPKRTGTE